MAIAGQLRRKLLKGSLFNDLRSITLILVGACIYLLLYSAFGRPARSSLTLEPGYAFPRKLWQSWRFDAVSFEERDAHRVRSWMKENPSLRYEVMTDSNALAYVQQTFGPQGFNQPDVVFAYQSLTAKIIKADLLRYIIMYAEGGIYADVDVEALMPFEDFLPRDIQEQDLDMIISVETDQPTFKDHPVLGVKAQSFCQWTFACKPRIPVMLRLINDIVRWLNNLKMAQQKEIAELHFDFDAVLNGTGPSAFTAAILAELSKSTGRLVDWKDFHGLRDPRVLDRVLVLPAEAFAAGTGHSDSGNHGSKSALVKHHFGASSWTTEHQRHKHPVYGEVERCNWQPECVQLWDLNTATFDALSVAEQLQILTVHQAKETPAQPDQEPLDIDVTPPQDDIDAVLESLDAGIRKEDNADAELENVDADAHIEDYTEDRGEAPSDPVIDRPMKPDIPDVATLEELLMQDT